MPRARDERFWKIFHEAWGEDSAANKDKKNQEYNKKAWTYVQERLERYFANNDDKSTK